MQPELPKPDPPDDRPKLNGSAHRYPHSRSDDGPNGYSGHRNDDGPSSAGPPAINPFTYFWQIVASICAAGVIGAWVLVWNLAMETRKIGGIEKLLDRIEGNIASSCSVVNNHSNRLTAIETELRHILQEIKSQDDERPFPGDNYRRDDYDGNPPVPRDRRG